MSVYRTDEPMPEPGGDGVPRDDDGPDNEGPHPPRRPCTTCGGNCDGYVSPLGECYTCNQWTKATNR